MASDLINSGIYEPWRIVPVMVVLFVLFSLRHFKVLDEPPAQHNNRSRTIDGLRGFLALGVFFAHGSGYYVYMKTGYWGAGPSVFFNQLGSIGVALFFIITSYLFWGKAVAASSHTRNAA